MAITRGQMQRQLRRGGGIMNIAPREQFGLGSSLKKFVRKVIPNEVAKVATVAAPFVAPFNPALAGAMAGIGSFDQTGSLSDAFKRGALTYGGGQAARFIGGADFQGNPFNEPLISSPLGTETGLKLGRFFEKPTDVSGVTSITGDEAALQKTVDKAALKNLPIEKQISEEAVQTFLENQAKTNVAPKSVIQLIKNQDYGEAAKVAAEKGFDAVFKKPVRNNAGKIVGYDLDKTALLAAGAFGLTYADAKKVADDAGVDIGTETEYDEATKAEKKSEYASYLTNFFEGKKDGGRIGFRFGDKAEDKEGIMSMSEDEKDKDEDIDDLMAGTGINFSRQEKSYLFRRLGGAGGADRSYTMPNLYRILNNPSRYPEDARVLKEIAVMGLSGKKDGGRIGFESGANKEYKFMELIDEEAYNKRLQEKEDLINELMDKGYRFEDIMQLVSPRAKRLMDDGTYKQYGDAPSISLGKIGFNMGGEVPVRKNKAGIEELDYRQTGGFVPVGVKEKADDVPAMLSKNEFVLTADAVRGIGGGDVEKGAEKLYGVMKQAEKVGRA